MRIRDLLLALLVVLVPSIVIAAPPAGTNWMAMSECAKSVQGKSGRLVKITIGLTTIDLDRAACDSIGKSKATGMASGGWSCSGDAGHPTHICSPIGKDEEELGLRNVRARTPVMNTYLVFTDLTGHLTQVSFWDMPNAVAMKFCDAFRMDVVKSGVKDAQCVPGNT